MCINHHNHHNHFNILLLLSTLEILNASLETFYLHIQGITYPLFSQKYTLRHGAMNEAAELPPLLSALVRGWHYVTSVHWAKANVRGGKGTLHKCLRGQAFCSGEYGNTR